MDFTLFIFMGAVVLLSIISFIMCLVCFSKLSSLSKTCEETEGAATAVAEYYKKIKAAHAAGAGLPVKLPGRMFCKMGIVRFNAFDDVTGAVSFSVALLNARNDGMILTSIYGRETCNTYIREVKRGECDINLLDEEQEALEKATSQEVK